uniref:Uncharacterized protein n=1 Tax=Rhizophora mucronata TaxID=61149 RepID=A0A2P2M818_RHIMU
MILNRIKCRKKNPNRDEGMVLMETTVTRTRK